MTKQCSYCFEDKPMDEFKAKHGRCRKCRAEIQRHLRSSKRGSMHLSPYQSPRVKYVEILIRDYRGTSPLEIPVKSLYNTVPAPKSCILTPVDGALWYRIASLRGTTEIKMSQCGPFELIRILGEMGLEIMLPNVKATQYGTR